MTAIPPSTRNTLHRFFTQSYPVISTTVSNGLENLRNSLTTDEANTDTTTGTNVDVDADIAQDESIVAISEHQMNEKWRRDNEERLKAKRLRTQQKRKEEKEKQKQDEVTSKEKKRAEREKMKNKEAKKGNPR